jgi:hypothetical protein
MLGSSAPLLGGAGGGLLNAYGPLFFGSSPGRAWVIVINRRFAYSEIEKLLLGSVEKLKSINRKVHKGKTQSSQRIDIMYFI